MDPDSASRSGRFTEGLDACTTRDMTCQIQIMFADLGLHCVVDRELCNGASSIELQGSTASWVEGYVSRIQATFQICPGAFRLSREIAQGFSELLGH